MYARARTWIASVLCLCVISLSGLISPVVLAKQGQTTPACSVETIETIMHLVPHLPHYENPVFARCYQAMMIVESGKTQVPPRCSPEQTELGQASSGVFRHVLWSEMVAQARLIECWTRASGTMTPVGGPPNTPKASKVFTWTYHPIDMPHTFVDLRGYGWASNAITQMAKEGVFQGVGGGKFDPAGYVTRAELATLVCRVFGLSHVMRPGPPLVFVDVAHTTWYYESVKYASPYMSNFKTSKGLMFKPNLDATRIEVAATLGKLVMDWWPVSPPTAQAVAATWAKFKDGATIPSGLAQDAAEAVIEGFVKGMPGAIFDGQARITRAQMAVVLSRMRSTVLR